jgi:hypothetical protein
MRFFLLQVFIIASLSSYSQCEIKNRISPEGTMMYFMDPVVFYRTSSKELMGHVVTDRENYFIGLRPKPFPEKDIGKKLKDDLELKLSNNKVYRLSYYDTKYLEKDTIMELFYLIDEQELNDLLNFETTEVRIDMQDAEGMRTYVFKLHKTAIQEQLACFLKERKDKKGK